MRKEIGYCWQKAAEYAARAEEAPDKQMRELFIRFRNSWINAAKRYQSSRGPAAGKSQASWPSSLAPELGTNAWDKRPTDGLTSVPAERLGAA
jgi:hypothetical protein